MICSQQKQKLKTQQNPN